MSHLVQQSSPFGLIAGTQVEVVGIEDGPDGDLHVYITHRSDGRYVVLTAEHAEEQQAVREAWRNTHSRLLIPTPGPAQVFQR